MAILNVIPFGYCQCGYGNRTGLAKQSYARQGVKKGEHNKFIYHHISRKNYIGINKGERNGMWKGEDVTVSGLHDYIRYNVRKPKTCKICGKKRFLDLANISGKYLRDFSDFQWICRSCHMISDGRINNLKKGRYS